MNKNILLIILFLQAGLQLTSQTIVAPNFILKSHETLEVVQVIRKETGTAGSVAGDGEILADNDSAEELTNKDYFWDWEGE